MATPPVLLLPPSSSSSSSSLRVLIAARFSGCPPPHLEQIPPDLDLGGVPWAPPLLRTPGGAFFGGGAAALLLSPPEMRGRDPPEAALVRQWVTFGEGELSAAAALAMGGPPQERPRGLQELRRGLGALEAHLGRGRRFLVGDSVTLADVTVTCALLGPFTQLLDPPARAPFPGVSRWFLTCAHLPQFRAVLGEVRLCGGEGHPQSPPQSPPETPQSPQTHGSAVGHSQGGPNLGVPGGPNLGVPGGPEPPTPPKSAAQLKKEAKKREKNGKIPAKTGKKPRAAGSGQGQGRPGPAGAEGAELRDPHPPRLQEGCGGTPPRELQPRVRGGGLVQLVGEGGVLPARIRAVPGDPQPPRGVRDVPPPPQRDRDPPPGPRPDRGHPGHADPLVSDQSDHWAQGVTRVTTGTLHLGHALTAAIQDTLTRW
uniref:GST C-terminal domain-containing protein n=1 Tax=Taeniopygia guttata TaxID=59729 RepID=A0A674GKB3_TAEGU